MGGRGGSSNLTTKESRQKKVSFDLDDVIDLDSLRGSEKQKKWAKDIITDMNEGFKVAYEALDSAEDMAKEDIASSRKFLLDTREAILSGLNGGYAGDVISFRGVQKISMDPDYYTVPGWDRAMKAWDIASTFSAPGNTIRDRVNAIGDELSRATEENEKRRQKKK